MQAYSAIYWEILAPVIATFVITIAMQAAVRAVSFCRARDYFLHKDKVKEVLAARFSLPAASPSSASDHIKSFWNLVSTIHREAIEAQTDYVSAVVRAATCLVLAFCALALSATPLREFEWFELVLGWLDAIAIGLVIFHFLRGRDVNERWIKLRTEAELLRQFGFIAVVFPSSNSPNQPHDLTSQFEAESNLIKSQVLKSSSTADLVPRIDRFWSDRRSSIEKRKLFDSDISGDALLLYLQKRALRQLGWFTESKMRLERNARRRSEWLLKLYSVALLLAMIKLGVVLAGVDQQTAHDVQILSWQAAIGVLSAALLIITGLSAAMTAYYLNQNARSLIHRYNMQERQIAKWFETLDARWPIGQLPSLRLDTARKNEIRNLILQFEDLMIEELVDWIHISSHDVIEIAP
jgi:hypothetical protein